MRRQGRRKALGFRTAAARVQTLDARDVTMSGTYWYDLAARRPVAARMKRCIDLAVAAPLVVICAPLFLFRSIRSQRRVGFRGNVFHLYVFPQGWMRGLPSLLNVLEGSLSLVGPRPLRPDEADGRGGRRFSVLPGITGLWRISDGEERELDRRYVNEWSVPLDLKILARTAGRALLGAPMRSASGRGESTEDRRTPRR